MTRSRRRRARLLAPLLALPLLVAPPALAQGGQDAEASAAAVLTEQDRSFAQAAALGGRRNVVLSEMMLDRSDHAAVRSFAEASRKQFEHAGKMLGKIASDLDLSLPRRPGENTQELKDAMIDLESPLLERQYVWNMLAAASVAENLFEEQAEEGRDPRLVGFAEKALPKLRSHRRDAARLWAELN